MTLAVGLDAVSSSMLGSVSGGMMDSKEAPRILTAMRRRCFARHAFLQGGGKLA